MRSDLRADLVPLPAADAHALLHHLPYFQLGSPDDVYADALCGQLLFLEPSWNVNHRLDPVGMLRAPFPGTLLGADQRRTAVLAVHGQAVHAVLPETEKLKNGKQETTFGRFLFFVC